MTLHKPHRIDRRALLARSAAAAVFAGFLPGQALAGQASPSPEAGGDATGKLVAGNTAFALDLYREFRQERDGNIVFSPLSVSLALAMVFAGARGDTADQMAQVLGVPGSETPAVFQALTSDLMARGNAGDDRGDAELRIANALWGEQSFPFSDAFVNELETSYDAGLRLADFMGDPEAARREINDWVADQTDDHIEEIVPEGVIDQQTRLVLANAIFFASTWRTTFDIDDTEDDAFHLADGATVKTPFMVQTAQFPYHQGDRARVVELPYAVDGFAMTIILPDEGQFDAVEDDLDVDALGRMADALEASRVEVHLPKFEFNLGESLIDMLESLGMTDAFDAERADLGGMIDDGVDAHLVISAVLHEAFVSIDEEGTEAAASTVAGISVTSAPLPDETTTLRIDRPFLFAIRDTVTGTVLFLGRVMDPSGE